MNMKIEHYEQDFESKVKKRIKDLRMNENDQNDPDAPNNYEKVI